MKVRRYTGMSSCACAGPLDMDIRGQDTLLWGRLLLHRSLERSVFWIKMLKDCFAHSASAFECLDAFMATFTGMTS